MSPPPRRVRKAMVNRDRKRRFWRTKNLLATLLGRDRLRTKPPLRTSIAGEKPAGGHLGRESFPPPTDSKDKHA